MALIKPEQLRSGSYSISGSFSGSFVGNLTGTSSYSDAATSASFALTASALTGFNPTVSTFTIELIDVLDLDFYAPFDMQINTVTDLVNTPTTTLEVEDVAYVLEDPITAGDKITVTVDTAAVVQLNAERI